MGEKLSEAESASRRTRRWWGFFIGTGVLIYLVWTQMLYPSYSVRYKLTVEVETPYGLKVGSSVIEPVLGWEPNLFGLIPGIKNRLYGEAVFVDLGGGKNLIVTLRGAGKRGGYNAFRLPLGVFEIPPHDRVGTPTGIARAKKSGPREIEPTLLPQTVTFADPNKRESVKLIDPRDLTQAFGSGYQITRVLVTMTNDRLPNTIEQKIPSLREVRDKQLSGKRFNDGSLFSLGYHHFKTDGAQP